MPKRDAMGTTAQSIPGGAESNEILPTSVADSPEDVRAIENTPSEAIDVEFADSRNNVPATKPVSFSSHGLTLQPGEPIAIHPVAAKFRRPAHHRERLTASLKSVGQLAPATVCRDQDGTVVLLDGVTRRELLHGLGKPLWCRFLEPSELGSRSESEWILEMNFHGAEGRLMTDTQRALQITEIAELIRAEAKTRSVAGKLAVRQDKGKTHEHLATLANCSPNRVKQALSIAKCASSALLEKVWCGEIALSKAASVCRIEDGELRKVAIRALLTKDDERLRSLLGTTTTDSLRQHVPASLARHFSMAAAINKALRYLANTAKLLEPHRDMLARDYLPAITSLGEELVAGKPYCLCEDCECTGNDPSTGSPCTSCQGKRFLTVREFNNATAARQERWKRVR